MSKRQANENVDEIVKSIKFRINSLIKFTLHKSDLTRLLEMKKCLEKDNQHYINFVDVIKQLEEMESKQQNTDSLELNWYVLD